MCTISDAVASVCRCAMKLGYFGVCAYANTTNAQKHTDNLHAQRFISQDDDLQCYDIDYQDNRLCVLRTVLYSISAPPWLCQAKHACRLLSVCVVPDSHILVVGSVSSLWFCAHTRVFISHRLFSDACALTNTETVPTNTPYILCTRVLRFRRK